jgi:N-acetylmuramidase-like protein/putative peptidoglycan binding protein
MPNSFIGQAVPIDDEGMGETLDVLRIGQAEVWAVLSVETGGTGFLSDRRPRILFERHIFRKETDQRFDGEHPDLSNRIPGGYAGGADEYGRLDRAIQLDRLAALRSASWGLGQVMGFNAEDAGFQDVEEMVKGMVQSENAQLTAMARWIDNRGIAGALRRHSWPDFARAYNGPGYKKNQYDLRLAGEFQKFKKGPLPDLKVRAAQTYLIFLGFSLGRVDGILGRLTRSAIRDFQAQNELSSTGEMSAALVQALKMAVYAEPIP